MEELGGLLKTDEIRGRIGLAHNMGLDYNVANL